MKFSISNAFKILLLGLVLYIGVRVGGCTQYENKNETSESVELIKERVNNVMKLVSKELYLSEIYNYKDYYLYDVSLFQKKAIIRVKAKALLGYDLEGMEMEFDEASKTVRLSNLPHLSLIAIDHELDYYDIKNGLFNSFTEKELTQLSTKAKDFIRKKIEEDQLLLLGEEEENAFIEALRSTLHLGGWHLELEFEELKN